MTTADFSEIIRAARQGGDAKPLDIGKVYAIVTAHGDVQTIDLTGDKYRDNPTHKAGRVTVRDVPSFVSLYKKHADDGTEVYADLQERTVTAVLDAHTADGARWQRHRLQLELRHTLEWQAWTARSGASMQQDKFADFLEDRVDDIAEPAAAELLEIVQSFQATVKAEFSSGTRLRDGQREISYTETTNTSGGGKKKLVIPEAFTLGLHPFQGFEDTERFPVTAKLRTRIEGTSLLMSYKLHRPEDVLNLAFADITKDLAEQLAVPILNGAPS